jgi:hypothetical protein
MKSSVRPIFIFLVAFVAIFTLNGALSMSDTKDFFYITPTKLAIRVLIAVMLTVQVESFIRRRKKDA